MFLFRTTYFGAEKFLIKMRINGDYGWISVDAHFVSMKNFPVEGVGKYCFNTEKHFNIGN